MPDRRRHRGPHPQDRALFAERCLPPLRRAVSDLSWLLDRGYPADSSAVLVGERYQLRERQRIAVRRCACSESARQHRLQHRSSLAEAVGRTIAVDGFNLLITVETALSGGLILIGRDGCWRDLATVWGTYRKIEETSRAIEAIRDLLATAGIHRVDWYLDRPVSNSGRLKSLIGQLLPPDNRWSLELVENVDALLRDYPGPIVTSDAGILGRPGPWLGLAEEVIKSVAPRAWKVDLGSTTPADRLDAT